ncbi:MAG: transposase domain-containing protein, partial [Burkholderia sp.]
EVLPDARDVFDSSIFGFPRAYITASDRFCIPTVLVAAQRPTLIGTCKLKGINPRAYLEYVRTHIADHKTSRIDELLPWNVADKLKPLTPPTLSTG